MSNAERGNGKVSFDTTDEFWRAFDTMPPQLRSELRNCAFPWSAVSIAEILQKRGLMSTVLMVRQAEATEVARFAKYNWPAKFGEYPHVAARATIMRGVDRVIF